MASQPQIRAAERVTAKETASAPSKEQEKAPEANEPAAESDEEVCPQCDIHMPSSVGRLTLSCYLSGGGLISELVCQFLST